MGAFRRECARFHNAAGHGKNARLLNNVMRMQSINAVGNKQADEPFQLYGVQTQHLPFC
jgi:hypothetical protein